MKTIKSHFRRKRKRIYTVDEFNLVVKDYLSNNENSAVKVSERTGLPENLVNRITTKYWQDIREKINN